jgi:CDP-6-deoxy-D-xylo-4-hexulose-3-dehydrase
MIKLINSTFYKEKQTKEKLVKFIMKSKKLSFDKECVKFEKNFARYQGRKHCVFVNSGSSANQAIIQTLLNLGMIKKGDHVGFSALTWSTNVMPLVQQDLKPIPIDVELNTLNVSSRTLATTLEKVPLKMLFLTNLLGFCDDIEQIKKMCREKNILLIEDNCESLGTVYKEKRLGNYGLAGTFSFYVGHHLSTIEGGAICTDSGKIATMLQIVRAHGWDRNLNVIKKKQIRHKFNINSNFYSRYTFYDLGFNFRPTEIAGFLGNVQLQYINEITEKRNANFKIFSQKLYRLEDKYYPIKSNHIDFVSSFAVPVVCRTAKTRDRLIETCRGKVEIRPVVGGDMTQQPFFIKHSRSYPNMSRCPNANLIHNQGLYFGNNPEMTDKDIKTILKIFM